MAAVPEGDFMNVEQFILENGIDVDAANQLRQLEPEMQVTVLNRGPVTGSRNPNSVLLSRIRQARQSGPGEKGFSGDAAPTKNRDEMNSEIQQFVAKYALDERAGSCLMEADAQVVSQILSRRLDDARNPSAVVLSLIRQVKDDISKGITSSKGKGKGAPPAWGYPPQAWAPAPQWDQWGKGGQQFDSWGKGKGKGRATPY